MVEGLEFLISGIVFGLAAGVAPGPLLALVFSETLKYGKKEGVTVAISPLITDLPIEKSSLHLQYSLLDFNDCVCKLYQFSKNRNHHNPRL